MPETPDPVEPDPSSDDPVDEAVEEPGTPEPTQRLTVGKGAGGIGDTVGSGLRSGLVAAVAAAVLVAGVVGTLVVLGRDDDGADRARPERSSEAPSTGAPAAPASSLDVPTIDPSDFPSDMPSLADVPTPSLESVLPSAFGDLPEQFPTDPSGWASFFEQQQKNFAENPPSLPGQQP